MLPFTPRPCSISVCSDLETTSRLASSIAFGAYRCMKRSPSFSDGVAALTTASLGYEDATRVHRRRVALHELHVNERHSGTKAMAMPSPVQA